MKHREGSRHKLSLELLRSFMAIFSERSVTLAAAQLGLSQSTVSSALAKLRLIYADPLFVPGKDALEPTYKALELSATLGEALHQIESSVIPRAAFRPETASTLFQIAMVDLVQDQLLPKLARALAAEAPALRLSVTPLMIDTVEASLASQRLDLAIASTQLSLRKVRYNKLYEEQFTCVLSKSHPAVRSAWTPRSFAALNHLQVTPTGSSYVSIIDRTLADHGLKRNVMLYMSSYRLAAKMVTESDFVALMPATIANEMAGSCALIVKEPPIPLAPLPIIQMWHERSHHDPQHRWLRQRIVSLCR